MVDTRLNMPIHPPCPKCNATSGDDWSQCEGSCPLAFTPYYDPQESLRQRAKDNPPPTTYPDSFVDYPLSITERRANSDGGTAHDWTVRDALIQALRDYDSGKIPAERIIIMFGSSGADDHTGVIDLVIKSPSRESTLSLIERAKMRLWQMSLFPDSV